MGSVYRLMVRLQVTRARLLSLVALGLLGVVVGAAIGAADFVDHTASGTRFIDVFGLSLLAPVTTLVFASAAFGDPTDDNTLVYLWLRPVARWKTVLAAYAASVTVAWPLVVGSLVLAAVATRGGGDLVVGVLIASTVSVLAYAAVFVALGLRVRRALVWGLLYIFIWEGFVATANLSAARLALRSYGRSLLSEATDVSLRLAEFTTAASVIVPLVVGIVGLAYAGRRFARQDIA
jgi:ABC-2 type transport system permease protein